MSFGKCSTPQIQAGSTDLALQVCVGVCYLSTCIPAGLLSGIWMELYVCVTKLWSYSEIHTVIKKGLINKSVICSHICLLDNATIFRLTVIKKRYQLQYDTSTVGDNHVEESALGKIKVSYLNLKSLRQDLKTDFHTCSSSNLTDFELELFGEEEWIGFTKYLVSRLNTNASRLSYFPFDKNVKRPSILFRPFCIFCHFVSFHHIKSPQKYIEV